MGVELANVAYRRGVGVNALATMCKLIGWLQHHQNTEQKKQTEIRISYAKFPRKCIWYAGIVSPAFLFAMQKFLLQR